MRPSAPLLSLFGLLCGGCPSPASAPAPARTPPAPETTADADPAARALAEVTLARMGGREAWESTRYLHWRFFGRREHWWDKQTGDVRIDSGEVLVLMNVSTKEGRAFKDGVEVADEAERRKLLDDGYAWWVNDSYWLVMPYKLLDPGVILRDKGTGELPDGRSARVLGLTFDSVGLTPENRYEVFVADSTQLVERWVFYKSATDTEPGMETEWSGWQPFGRIWLATSRGQGPSWDISVADELPRTVFTSPDKPAG